MSRRTRRTHSPSFKAKVALAHRLAGVPVDFFLLEAAPETLHVHVVEPDEMILAPIRVSRCIPLYNDSKLALKQGG